MANFKGYIVPGHRDNPNLFIDGVQYVRGSLLTKFELQRHLQGRQIPPEFERVNIPRSKVIYLFGGRFIFNAERASAGHETRN